MVRGINMKSILYSAGKIGNLEVKNRIAMTAMHSALSNNGTVNDALLEYFRVRARGGAGIIIVGAVGIDPVRINTHNVIQVYNDSFIPGLKKLTAAVQEAGAAVFAQLWHPGRYARSAEYSGAEAIAPSAVPSRFTGETPRELGTDEIEEVIAWYAEAAERAKIAGFDGIEVTAASGYLPAQFLSPVTNRRTDKYGGDLTARMTFLLEIISAVRQRIGADFPLVIRIGSSDFIPGGNINSDAVEICRTVEAAGADAISMTGGWHETAVPQLTMDVPYASLACLCSAVKRSVDIPVLLSNRMNTETAEEAVDNGICDFVGFARSFLADPSFPEKAEVGKHNLIRRCIGCNQACMDSIFYGGKIGCLVNPEAGHEAELMKEGRLPSEILNTSHKKILVIGAGIAGMAYAEAAAAKGNSVTILEKEQFYGGQAYIASRVSDRKCTFEFVEYLYNSCVNSGVRFEFGIASDANNILSRYKNEEYEKLVIATGSKPVIPEIVTDGSIRLVHAWDVLKGTAETGNRVIISGSNQTGIWTALELAAIGTPTPEQLKFLMVSGAETPDRLAALITDGIKEITITEPEEKAAGNIGPSTRWSVLMQLKKYGIKTELSTRLGKISDGKVELISETGRQEAADTIIFTSTVNAEPALYETLKNKVGEILVLGDADKKGNMMSAVKNAYNTGMLDD